MVSSFGSADANTSKETEQLLAMLPPDRRRAVKEAAQFTSRGVMTGGAFNTRLSKEPSSVGASYLKTSTFLFASPGLATGRLATGRLRRVGLQVASGIVGIAAAALIISACVLPLYTWNGTSYSLFSGLATVFALEPVVAAFLGFCAGGLLMFTRRPTGLLWLAAGMLLALGIQTSLLFAGYQYGLTSPQHPTTGAVIGLAGGLVLAVAGVLGVISNFRNLAVSVRSSTPDEVVGDTETTAVAAG
jgi:hypothetical protein